MVIERDRYLDDGRTSLVTLRLQSRTLEMHSLMTSLTPEEREEVGAALVRALDDIVRVLQGARARNERAGVRP